MENRQKMRDWIMMGLEDIDDANADFDEGRYHSSVLKSMFENQIQEYLSIIKERFDISSVVLFGSVARKEAKDSSDIDLLIISSFIPPDLYERVKFVHVKKPSRIEAIWMTPNELNGMVEAKTGFVLDALIYGKILYDDGTVKEAKERLIRSLKKLNAQKIEHGWFIPRKNLAEVISFD